MIVQPGGEDIARLPRLLAAYIALLPVQIPVDTFFRFAPSDYCLILYFIVRLSRLRLVRSAWSLWHAGIIAAFLSGTIVSALEWGSVSRYVFVNKDLGLLLLLAGYAAFTDAITDWSQVRHAARLFVAGTVVQCALAIAAFYAQRTFGIGLEWLNYQSIRLSGLLVDPNAYGGLLITAFGIHIAAGRHSVRSAWLRPLCTFVLALGTLLTYSRSAWIGMACILLAVSVVKPAVSAKVAVAAVAGTCLALLIFGAGYGSYAATMAVRTSPIDSRLDILHTALPLWSAHPVFGIGIGTFLVRRDIIIHNTPLWILTELGAAGFIVFIGFVSWFVVKGLTAYVHVRGPDRDLVLGLTLSHIAMLGLSVGIEALYQRHWWLMLGLIGAACSLRGYSRPRYQLQ